MADRFVSMTWTSEPDGSPVTLCTIEGAVRDVACYALPGHGFEAADWHAIARHGIKLSEARARELGCGWPSRLSYRR